MVSGVGCTRRTGESRLYTWFNLPPILFDWRCFNSLRWSVLPQELGSLGRPLPLSSSSFSSVCVALWLGLRISCANGTVTFIGWSFEVAGEALRRGLWDAISPWSLSLHPHHNTHLPVWLYDLGYVSALRTEPSPLSAEFLRLLAKHCAVVSGTPFLPWSLSLHSHHNTKLTCQLDTGSTCNVISIDDVSVIMQLGEPKLKTTSVKLRLFGGTTMRPLGECRLPVEYNGRRHLLNFQVVEDTCSLVVCLFVLDNQLVC